jgi:hypothetical protein
MCEPNDPLRFSGPGDGRRLFQHVPVDLSLADSQLRSAYAIGFLVLFVFTYVNFDLVALRVSPITLGLVYPVFLLSMRFQPHLHPQQASRPRETEISWQREFSDSDTSRAATRVFLRNGY